VGALFKEAVEDVRVYHEADLARKLQQRGSLFATAVFLRELLAGDSVGLAGGEEPGDLAAGSLLGGARVDGHSIFPGTGVPVDRWFLRHLGFVVKPCLKKSWE
jgi:hypothetical protein